jgi:hypothetical protein
MENWPIWGDIGFGFIVIAAFLWAGLKAYTIWVDSKNKPPGEDPLNSQLILKIVNDYSERQKESTQVLTSLTTAITELNATQREMSASFARMNSCMDDVQLRLNDVVDNVDKHNDLINDVKTQLAVLQAGIKS